MLFCDTHCARTARVTLTVSHWSARSLRQNGKSSRKTSLCTTTMLKIEYTFEWIAGWWCCSRFC